MTPLPFDPLSITKGQRLVVAVDGPAGAGKGAVCRGVANHFDLTYLDTGSLYRAVGLLSLKEGVEDPEQLGHLAANMDFVFQKVNPGVFCATLFGQDVTQKLREEHIGQTASKVAAMPQVRQALLAFQRQYGGDKNIILDGRDVGTIVWPDADLKLYLSASLQERAKRRALELQARGETVNFAEILATMAQRDKQDSERTHAPLRAAKDAITVDTTQLTRHQSIERVIHLLEKFF